MDDTTSIGVGGGTGGGAVWGVVDLLVVVLLFGVMLVDAGVGAGAHDCVGVTWTAPGSTLIGTWFMLVIVVLVLLGVGVVVLVVVLAMPVPVVDGVSER